jgi:hypothetical protein
LDQQLSGAPPARPLAPGSIELRPLRGRLERYLPALCSAGTNWNPPAQKRSNNRSVKSTCRCTSIIPFRTIAFLLLRTVEVIVVIWWWWLHVAPTTIQAKDVPSLYTVIYNIRAAKLAALLLLFILFYEVGRSY